MHVRHLSGASLQSAQQRQNRLELRTQSIALQSPNWDFKNQVRPGVTKKRIISTLVVFDKCLGS